jgi:rhodanese-related sulfurtransferase
MAVSDQGPSDRLNPWRSFEPSARIVERGFTRRKTTRKVYAGGSRAPALGFVPSIVQSISPEELRLRLRGDAPPYLLDVREVEELSDGAISGSVNIPMGEVEERLNEVPRDREVVVICHLGGRSAYVTKRLNALGYDRALNLHGGMEAWKGEPPSGERAD